MTDDEPIRQTEHDLLAVLPVALAASAFINLIWGRHDFLGAWRLVDPIWRRCWTQTWLYPAREAAAEEGWNVDEVVEAFADDDPQSHQFWSLFERSQLRGLLEWGDLTQWNPGTGPRLIAPGIETVVFFPPGVTFFRSGETQMVHYFMMRHSDDDDGWRVLNLNSENVIPEPGWPPRT